MNTQMPTPGNILRDDFTTGRITGGRGNDHLIHHRDPSVEAHSSTGLIGYAGDDILEAYVPDRGQIHMFAATGNDWLILDVTKIQNAAGMQGHHAYGGHGQNTFQFRNVAENMSPIMGRLDDFDPTSDRILIENIEIDLTRLPKELQLPDGDEIEVRVIETEHLEYIGENLGKQHFLAIGDNIFYALESARDLQNGVSGNPSDHDDMDHHGHDSHGHAIGIGEERHFLLPSALEALRSAESVQYVNPKNFVPREFYEHREDELNLNWSPNGAHVTGDTGNQSAAHMFGGKGNPDAPSSSGEQIMRGSDGDDVINGNTGNDTIFGGYGNDLIAGGIDHDVLYGGPGDDMIWGGDGNDRLYGGRGDDYLHGGRGDDFMAGGEGNDTLVGGRGNNTLVGGGGDDAVNRFHFAQDEGHDVITDFKVETDMITLQHEINPLTVELYSDEDGNTVLNFGQKASVEIRGVPLDEFKQAAEVRAEDGNAVIQITPDPEDELLQSLRIETGYYGEKAPPSLHIEGVLYGNDPFISNGAGGYTYILADSETEDEHQEENSEPSVSDDERLPHRSERESDETEEDPDDKDENTGSCFIATAAYRDPSHPDVIYLRAFRDQWLTHRPWGRAFISFYWRVGPVLASPVRQNFWLGSFFRMLISAIVRTLRKFWADTNSTQPHKKTS